MKVKFTKTYTVSGSSANQNDHFGQRVKLLKSQNHPMEFAENDINAYYKQSPRKINDLLKTATTKTEGLSITIRSIPAGAEWFGSQPNEFDYSFKVTLESIDYECLQVLPDDEYQIVEPDTGKIFKLKADGEIDAYVVKE